MKFETTSAFKFEDTASLPFSIDTYSRMKFGDKKSAKYCADSILVSLIKKFEEDGIPDNIVVSPSPYQLLPKSSHHIFESFVSGLNKYLFSKGKNIATTTRIRSCHIYDVDYGTLDLYDREQLIGKDNWTFNIELLKNAYFIILDDLKMTGTLEKTCVNQLNRQDIFSIANTIHFCYFAENIGVGKVPDNFENILNHHSVKTVEDFLSLIRNAGANFAWNMRNIKWVLELPQSELEYFIYEYPNSDLLDVLITSNCQSVKKYKKSFEQAITTINLKNNIF